MAPVPAVGPGEAREVAARRVVAGRAVRVPALDVGEQQAERAHVLLVVDHDARQGVDRAAAQHLEVDRPGSPSPRRRRSRETPRSSLLHGAQAGVLHAVPEHAPHERQQVQVPGVRRAPARPASRYRASISGQSNPRPL